MLAAFRRQTTPLKANQTAPEEQDEVLGQSMSDGTEVPL